MGFGSFLKKALGGIGDVAKFAAPALSLIPGVGIPLSAGIGAAGGLLGGLNNEGGYNFGNSLKEGALSAGSAYALGKAGDKLGGGFLNRLGAIPGVGAQALGLGGQQGGGINWPGLLFGGISAFGNAQDATQQRELSQEELAYARDQQKRRQEIQDKILGNLNPALNVPDLGGTFADPTNPFYQAPIRPMATDMGGMVPGVGGIVPQQPMIQPEQPPIRPDLGGIVPQQPPIQLRPPVDPTNELMNRLRATIPENRGGGGFDLTQVRRAL